MAKVLDDSRRVTITLVHPPMGQIVSGFGYPVSLKYGETMAVSAAVRNVGGSSGQFRLDLYVGATRVGWTGAFTVGGGTVHGPHSINHVVPSAGTGIVYTLKCVNITTGAVDATETFTVKLIAPARGQIVSTISPPSAGPGETITVGATVKNVGGSAAGFSIAVNGKMTAAFALAPGTQTARSVTMMMTGDTTSLDINLYRYT